MPDETKNSEAFTKMAARIDHNSGEPFGGAFVVIPPAGAGSQIEGLLLNSLDPAQFWLLLQAQVNKALEEVRSQPVNSPYGRPR